MNITQIKHLRPDARISPTITLINSDVIGKIEVVSGGKNYISAPDLVVVDPETGLLTDQGVIELELSSSSVSEVNVISSPKGLKPIEQRIRTINNSNGVSISQVVGMSTTSTVGVVTCTLSNSCSRILLHLYLKLVNKFLWKVFN